MRGLILMLSVLVSGCRAQDGETFWKTEDVRKVDGSMMTGITLAYMEALAGWNIHLAKRGDTLVFHYPHEREVKIDGLESVTGYRLETGQLVDSIYDVGLEDRMLKLKFHYAGTDNKDKRFSLNLVPMDKAEFLAEVARLKEERKQLMDKVKPVEISGLDLSIPRPAYFNDPDLTALSPMQGVEEFLGVKSDTIQPIWRPFDYRTDEGKVTYDHMGVITSAKDWPYAATYGDIRFSELEFITQAKAGNTEAIILADSVLETESLGLLFDAIDKAMPQAVISYEGLPERLSDGTILGIDPAIALTWSGTEQVVKLLIDVPDELYDTRSDGKSAVAATEEPGGADIRKVFRHYLDLIKSSRARVFIVSRAFDTVLKSDDYSGEAWGNIENYYTGD